jgi:hypothetical protein
VIKVFTNKNLTASNMIRGEEGTGTSGGNFDPFAFSILEEALCEIILATDSFDVTNIMAKQGEEEGQALFSAKAPFVQMLASNDLRPNGGYHDGVIDVVVKHVPVGNIFQGDGGRGSQKIKNLLIGCSEGAFETVDQIVRKRINLQGLNIKHNLLGE